MGFQVALRLIEGGRSSPILASAAVLFTNDMLHSSGLITDDCWNAVKGWSQTFNTVGVFGTATSALKTLVEAGGSSVESAIKLAQLSEPAAEEVTG